jgi:hypothetical protein
LGREWGRCGKTECYEKWWGVESIMNVESGMVGDEGGGGRWRRKMEEEDVKDGWSDEDVHV